MAEMIKVLIVDDIPETREMLKRLLSFEADIEVVDAATTGREGLELATQYKPDIVLMDINMPDMDGITATEEIKKLVPTAGVIMMSVQSESDYLRRAMLAGARDFLTKPISGENLYETIKRVYDLNEEARERFSAISNAGDGAAGKARKREGGNIISVYSPTGGSGVTTIATNLAVSLMREGTRVLLIDGDLQFGDVGVFLNLQANTNILDLSESVGDLDEQLIDSVTVSHGSGLRVLLAPRTPDEAERVTAQDFTDVVKEMTKYYDYVIVDMSKRLDDISLNILDAAERIVLVATPTLPSIKNVRVMLDLFNALEYPEEKVMFVMNRVSTDTKSRAFIPIEAIENNLKRKADGRIPLDDRTFLSAVNQGVSVIANEPSRSPAADLLAFSESLRHSFLEDGFEEEEPIEPQQQQTRGLSGLFRLGGN